jgi:hypothetical protein
MDDQVTIDWEDCQAIFAALSAIGRVLERLPIKGREHEAVLYGIWNNLDVIRLHLSRAGQERATRN